MRLPAEIADAVVAHALTEAPAECCGFLELDYGGRALAAIPAENVAASPYRFEVAPRDLLRIVEITDRGGRPVIYHSHTRSAPEPSQTDLGFAAAWPGVPWLIVGISTGEPELRCYEIEGGVARERAIERI